MFKTKLREYKVIKRAKPSNMALYAIGPSGGHVKRGHCDPMGPILDITSTRGAISKNKVKIIIIGYRYSLP